MVGFVQSGGKATTIAIQEGGKRCKVLHHSNTGILMGFGREREGAKTQNLVALGEGEDI